MTRHEHLYLKLMEEAAEVQQRVSKLLQFGSTEVEPGQTQPNDMRLRAEINDFLAIVEMIEDAGFLTMFPGGLELHIAEKREKVEKYLHYSMELGRVE